MEAKTDSTTNRIITIRSNKWVAGASAMFLGASLILSACGGSSEPVVESTVEAPAATEPAATPEVTETEDITSTEGTTGTEDVIDSEGMTETDGMTGTEEMTGTQDVTGSEDITETEGMTGTEEMTGTEGATESEGVTETEGMTETGAADTAGAATAMMGVSGVENQYVRASTLLDYSFENTGGEVSGDLEDIFIDLSTGRVLFTSIEYGGVLDLGDKDIVVPLNAFVIGQEGELVLNIDETALENYPDVGNDWPNLDDPTWDDEVFNFWSETGIDTGPGFEEATTSVARASELIGLNIADLGAGAGSILDILVNLGTAQAPYFIVDYGEGLDTDPYIIPLSAYDVTTWQEGLVYGPDFTPDLLENAPRFDQDAYPEGTPIDNDFGDTVESWWNDMGFSNDLNNDGQVD
jgi:hypothetical protein